MSRTRPGDRWRASQALVTRCSRIRTRAPRRTNSRQFVNADCVARFARGAPDGSVAVRLVPDPAAEARVHADVLELEPEGPPWRRPVVEVATLEELWPQRSGV